MNGFAIFDTAIGPCGVAWRGDRIVGSNLPEAHERALAARLARRFPDLAPTPPPDFVAGLIDRIQRLSRGEKISLADAPLDRAHLEPFANAVYDENLKLAPGETTTYGDIARRLGDVALARAVGRALGANPFPIIIPCHRVVGANGALVGFSAEGGVDAKRRLLDIEGAFAIDRLPLFGA